MNGSGPSDAWLQGFRPLLDAQGQPIPMTTSTVPAGNPTGYPSLANVPPPPPPAGAPAGPPEPPTPASNTPPPATFGSLFSSPQGGGVGLPGAPGPVAGGPGVAPLSSGANNAPPPPPPNGGMSSANEDPARGMSIAAPAMSQGPTSIPVGVEPPHGAPPPQPDVQFRPVGGGITPAHEAVTRGPKQNALLERSFEHPIDAALASGARAEETASHEGAVYDALAEESLKRQEALERVAQRRAAEQQQMRDDYNKTIQQLANTKLDTNRAWANSSTLDKIGALSLIFLGGVFSGNGGNKLKAAIDSKLAEDVELQKWDYQKGLDLARAQQTAFGLAMDQYGSEDAAYHASLAAAQQATAMKLGSLAAEWKGTDAGNRATELASQYMMLADQNAAAGFKFVPAAQAAQKYKMSIRGQEVPGYVDEKTAQGYAVEHGVKPGERIDEKMVEGGIQSTIEAQKQRTKGAEKANEGAAKISTALLQAGVPQARQAAEEALAALNKSPGGVTESAARRGIEVAGPLGSGPAIASKVMSNDANEREQKYWAFKNATMKAMMGNVTESEMARAEKQLGSATDPESRRRAIQSALNTLEQIEKTAKAASDVEGQEEFDRRRAGATGGPPAAPSTAKKGW